MATQNKVWVVLVIVTMSTMAQAALGQTPQRFSFTEPHLGTIVELTIYAAEEGVANEGARAAFARIKELDRIFSDYKADSEVMRLCQASSPGHPVKVSRELFQLTKVALDVSERTDGAFDVTVGPLIVLWRRARKEKTLPPPDQLAAAKELVGWKLVILNERDQTIELQRSGMRVDFGGIAKGYIAKEVLEVLRDRGLKQSLVAVAGDIAAGEHPPAADFWRIGIAPLSNNNKPDQNRGATRFLKLNNKCVSTSGDAFQFVEINGVRYSHIVDPQTGLGLTRSSSVTVIADDGTLADAWDTAICVMGPEKGLPLIEGERGVAALVVQATNDGVQTFESKEFQSYESK